MIMTMSIKNVNRERPLSNVEEIKSRIVNRKRNIGFTTTNLQLLLLSQQRPGLKKFT